MSSNILLEYIKQSHNIDYESISFLFDINLDTYLNIIVKNIIIPNLLKIDIDKYNDYIEEINIKYKIKNLVKLKNKIINNLYEDDIYNYKVIKLRSKL